MRDIAIALYDFAAAYARARGIIIADTKFEFGLDAAGELTAHRRSADAGLVALLAGGHLREGTSPPSFDKQFVRDYLETLDWNKQPPGPALPRRDHRGTRAKYREATASGLIGY